RPVRLRGAFRRLRGQPGRAPFHSVARPPARMGAQPSEDARLFPMAVATDKLRPAVDSALPRAMHTSSVVLIAMLTSVLTAAGTSYLLDRYKILPEGSETAGTVVVPELKGLLEVDARKNAEAVQIALLVAGREPTEEQKDGTVLRQSVPAGQRVPPNHPVSVVLAQEALKVPAITGLPIGEATLKLKEKGFEIKAGESVPSADVESGL